MSKHQLSILLLFLLVNVSGVNGQVEKLINHNKSGREEWLRDAGFGMFVHWSFDSQLGIVISHSVVGASEDYQNRFFHELPKSFNPEKYNPKAIAALAKLAGMKYVVFTAKHHSGFCMWDTKTTDFSIMHTPYAKDILKEYADAVRNEGLEVGLYFSPEDFNFLYRYQQPIQRRGIENIPDDVLKDYIDFTNEQCRELMTNYGTIDVLFFDGGIPVVLEEAKELCWKLNPDVLITRGAIETPEQSLPGIPLDETWESCVTMGTQWQYKPTNEIYKPGQRLIEILIETRAKGGALLLNVGPNPEGEIPVEQKQRLREIAAWYFINQDAILNVRPWVVTHEDNIWFTKQKDKNTVYAIVTGIHNWPRGSRKEFILSSVKSTHETKVSVLGQSDKRVEYHPDIDATSRFHQMGNSLQVSVVKAQRIYNNQTGTDNPLVIKLENVIPALDPPKINTLEASLQNGIIECVGEIVSLGDAENLMIGMEYRPYAGFGFELYDDSWAETKFQPVNKPQQINLTSPELKQKGSYQVRIVAKHPKIKMKGNIVTVHGN